MRSPKKRNKINPIIDRRQAVLSYLLEAGLVGSLTTGLILFLDKHSRLALVLAPPEGLPTNPQAILRAALACDAAAFLIVSNRENEELNIDISATMALCREYDIHFIDHLIVSGSSVRSVIWDRETAA